MLTVCTVTVAETPYRHSLYIWAQFCILSIEMQDIVNFKMIECDAYNFTIFNEQRIHIHKIF